MHNAIPSIISQGLKFTNKKAAFQEAYCITIWKNKTDKTGTQRTCSLYDFEQNHLAHPPVYNGPDDPNWLAWSPCVFTGSRSAENATDIAFLVVDYEASNGIKSTSINAIIATWCKCVGWVHTTRRHTTEHPRCRVVVKLSRPVNGTEYRSLYKLVLKYLDGLGHKVDQKTFDPGRIWFLPGKANESAEYRHQVFGGDLVIDVDAVLAMAPAPPSKVQSKPHKTKPKNTNSRPLPLHDGAPFPPLPEQRAKNWAQGTLERLRDRVATAPEGSRNATLNSAGYQLFRYVGSGLLDAGAVEQALREAAAQAGLTQNETLATIDSARAGETNPAWPYENGDNPPKDGPPPIKKFTKEREERTPANSNEDWGRQLSRTEKGNYRHTLRNLALILQHEYDIAYDIFHDQPVLLSRPPHDTFGRYSYPRPWADHDNLAAVTWFDERYLINTNKSMVDDAMMLVSKQKTTHPVREYLSSLKHDGRPRLDCWLTKHFGAKDSTYVRAAGRCYLISAVARIFEPGCKVDTVLVLQSPQGCKKSSAFKVLFDPWFGEEIADFGSRDAAVQCRGVWCVELPELKGMRAGDVETVKAFISRRVDRYVQKYEKHPAEHPRSCVFGGTTNEGAFLQDETGNRRFWPVPVNKLEIEGLIEEKDQLWAEAVAAYHAGESWWFTDPALVAEQAEAAEAVREIDAWQGEIETYLVNVGNLEFIPAAELFREALQLEVSRWGKPEQMRLSRVMTALGFAPYRKMMAGGLRVRGYLARPRND